MQTVTNYQPGFVAPPSAVARLLPSQPQHQREDHPERQFWLINRLSNLKHDCRMDFMLAKLIIRSDIVSAKDLDRAIEAATATDCTVSRVLPILLPAPDLCVALKAILVKVLAGTLTFDQAIKVARKVRYRPQSVQSELRLACGPTWTAGQSVMDFLLIAGLISHTDIARLGSNSLPNTLHGLRLASVGLLDSFTLHAAIRLRYFLNQGSITLEQSLSILQFSLKYRIDVDSVFLSRN